MFLVSSVVLWAVLSAGSGRADDAPPGLSLADPLFQDHMVFQRDAPIRIWGGGTLPGETVAVEMAGHRVETKAHSTGWEARLPVLSVGGPHTLTITASGGGSQTLTDVLVGDVFLCSGQSNMEMSVVRALNSWAEVHGAGNDRIRMTKIPRAAAVQPRSSFPAPLQWQAATPETVGDWSAVCYFFARELQKTVDVPMGLIDASWGGSDVRAWMTALSLAEVGGYAQALAQLRDFVSDEQLAQRRFGEAWESWWRVVTDATGAANEAADEPWQPSAGGDWRPAPEDLGDWKSWGLPKLETFDGMVWFRAFFELTAEQAAQDATLVLGGVDEVDQTWINGHIVGNTFGWGDVRRYEIPSDRLREGENVVVTNVYSAWDAGGLVGDEPRRLVFEDGTSAPLEDWRYRWVESPKEPPRAPWESIAGRTTLYNAMISPMRHLELRGALWYQGESNTAQGLGYAQLLDGMFHGWRRQFRNDLPFLVVQLAGFGPRQAEPTESGLAEVREAQRVVARDDPLTALVTAVDVGDVYDVHPPNKQEVGRRLARAARHLIYGENITPSGPLPARAVRQGEVGRGDTARVEFDDVVGGLVAYGHTRPIGFELCGDAPDTCRWADAEIDQGADGDAVVLRPAGDATRVRYCWADSPVCTLYDEAGLPAIPFELTLTR